jgi:hypothetical protein
VGGHDQRDAVRQLDADPAKQAVPGVAVDDVGVDIGGGHRDVAGERSEDRTERPRRRELAVVQAVPSNLQAALVYHLVSERPDLDVDQFR